MSLYKYVSPTWGIDFLRKGRIRFTQPSAFNDPFDSKPFVQSVTGGLDPSELSQLSKPIDIPLDKRKEMLAKVEEKFGELERMLGIRIPPRLPQKLVDGFVDSLSNGSLMQILEQDETIVTLRNILLSNFSAQVGILSLAEQPDNLLMWSHYSGQHTGFVIEFDEEHPFFKSARDATNGNSPTLRKVQYSVGRPERPHINLKDFMDLSWCWVKSEDWKYEQEWRMIRPLELADECLQRDDKSNRFFRIRKSRDEETWRMMRFIADALKPNDRRYIYLFSLPSDSIKAVILGCRMSKKDSRKILRIFASDTRYSHVETHIATTDERNFRLNIAQLKAV
ncbi:MAG: DUF2971 domain-containing protein [Pyrinomonadaceae bacterium]